MTRHVSQELAGWGNFPRQTVRAYRPDTAAEVAPLLAERPAESFIARGLGRSYGDASLNEGQGVLRCERLNRFLAWDAPSATLECEGGVSYQDILETFLPRGFFPAVTPGTKFVTVGGALACDVHGKNHHRDGSLASFVESFRLQTGAGRTLTCSRTENAEAFWATLGGLGLTGVILSARMRLLPVETAYCTVDYRKAPNLDAALEAFADDGAHRYSVAWIDCLASGAKLGRSVLMRGDHTPLADLPDHLKAAPLAPKRRRARSVPRWLPSWLLNSWTVRLFNKLYYWKHSDGRQIVDFDRFFYPLDAIHNWNRIYGKNGFVQYQCVLPHATSRAGLVALLEKLSASRRASFLAVLKTFGPGNSGLLSFPSAGATLALDLKNTGPDLLALLDELDQIVLQNGGRVYLAKDARMSRTTFEAMYPNADAFRAVKAQLDPDGLFDSSLARRLGLSRSITAENAENAEKHKTSDKSPALALGAGQ